jgi:hypothetical protein
MLRAYLEGETAAEVWPKDVPGRWVAEDTWPSPRIAPQIHYLNAPASGTAPGQLGTAPGQLGTAPGPEVVRVCKSQETLGLTKREWFPFNLNIELPKDQTADDRRSLTFDSAPLARATEILGNPIVHIRVKSDQPVAKLAVRLNEVKPDGVSWNVSYGILNLTHRDGHEHPSPLDTRTVYDVDVSCYFTAHTFQPGSRIRVAVSESLWPLVWPSPRPVTLEITTGASHLSLPVRPRESREESIDVPLLRNRIAEREATDPGDRNRAQVTVSGPDEHGRVMIRKVLRGEPETFPDIGTTVTEESERSLSITEGDPNSSVWRVESSIHTRRGAWDTRLMTSSELTSTAEEFHLKEGIKAIEGEKVVFERSWDQRILRELM